MNDQENKSFFLSESSADNYLDKLHLLIDLYPSGLFLLNDAALLYDINKIGQAFIGRRKEEILGRNFSELVDERDREQFRKTLQKASETSEPQSTELRIKGADNNYFHSLAMIRSELLPDLRKKFFVLALIDFTSQKMKEEFNKESEIRFENMANTAPVMLWIADREGLFSFVNKVWLDYSGKQIGDQLGMNWLKDVYSEDLENLLNGYRDAFESRESFTFEFRLKGKNNKYEWMIIRGTPRLSSENIFMGFIGSCTNINAQKEFEEKIQKVNANLTEINAAKDKFFSIISHDLRGPLGGLVEILGILTDTSDPLDEAEKQEIIIEATNSAKQTFALAENLLEWSRIQTGKIPFKPEKIELFSMISNLESLYNQNLKNKGIEFKAEISPGISVFADVKITETILRNLISNAIKFTKQGGTISITSEVNENFVVIKVTDTGVGMDAKNLAKLFRTDVSHSTKGTAKETGTGLGLILCKELVEKQGGKIGVESKKDQGSTFYFTLPAN